MSKIKIIERPELSFFGKDFEIGHAGHRSQIKLPKIFTIYIYIFIHIYNIYI